MTPGRSEDDRLAAIRERLRQFVRDREWSQFHDPKNLVMALASEAGELLAHFRWVLTGDADAVAQDPDKRQQIEQEIADVAIAVLLFCDRTGIDLFDAIDRKISLNERHYPVAESTGRSERPSAVASADPMHPRIMAVDWSGEAGGGRKTIWIAEVIGGRLARLENGRSRSELIDFLVESAAAEPNLIVGLDFAFAFPRWFAEQQGLRDIRQLWALAEREGEQWLRTCNPPFWGRPGQTKPKLPAHYRATELAVGRKNGGQAKSVFQIGGAGAVGTGSIRGMPHLGRLSSEGFSVWPFDPPSLPLVVEIYPRLLTGAVVKSSEFERARFFEERHREVAPEFRARASTSEDAFDAAVSALAMWSHLQDLLGLARSGTTEEQGIEGEIWSPGAAPLRSE